jgi:hypothetical protein
MPHLPGDIQPVPQRPQKAHRPAHVPLRTPASSPESQDEYAAAKRLGLSTLSMGTYTRDPLEISQHMFGKEAVSRDPHTGGLVSNRPATERQPPGGGGAESEPTGGNFQFPL